jgi:hypothetical protein
MRFEDHTGFSGLWYGMPAYAMDGKVVCFFQSARKFKTRYATLGFMHEASLDDNAMWPTAFALKDLTAAEEARIGALGKSGELRTKSVAEGCGGTFSTCR